MKSLFILTILFLANFAVADMAPPRPNLRGELVKAKLDPNYDQRFFAGGDIIVNRADYTLELRFATSPCNPKLCKAPWRLHEAFLPVVAHKVDSCNVVTVVARKDDRPVDGLMQEIVLRDFSRMTCKKFVPDDEKTQVRFLTVRPKRSLQPDNLKTLHRLFGTKLEKAIID